MAVPKCSSSSSQPSTWSALPKDVLAMVLSRLDLVDHVRFSAVCKWWRWIAAVENPATNKHFTLACSDHGWRLVRRLFFSTWPSWVRTRTLGSLEGWLVLHTDHHGGPNGGLYLLNPSSSGPPISLPRLPFPLFKPLNETHNLILSLPWHKVILSSLPSSSSECLIVLKTRQSYLAFCRLGVDPDWTYFHIPWKQSISDITFCNDQLYAITREGDISIFDPANLISKPIELYFPSQFRHGFSTEFYLATANASNGDKLFAVKKVGYEEVGYEVLEVDHRRGSFVKVESLGDNILFLSPLCSLTLLARDHPDLRPNHLYICSDSATRSFISYSLDDETTVRVNTMHRSPLFFTLFGNLGF